MRRRALIVSSGVVLSIVATLSWWLATREDAPAPTFTVDRPECETRASGDPPTWTRLVADAQNGPDRTAMTMESNGRWERRTIYADGPTPSHDFVEHGCTSRETFASFFAELAAAVEGDAGLAPPRDGLDAAPCIRAYASGASATELPWDRCLLTDLATRVMAVVRPLHADEPGYTPAACVGSRCAFSLTVGSSGEGPHGGSGDARTFELHRDGTYVCPRADDTPLRGRLTPGEPVFTWLIDGAIARTDDEQEATTLGGPVAEAWVLDTIGAPRATLASDTGLRRWRAIAAQVDPACIPDAVRR